MAIVTACCTAITVVAAAMVFPERAVLAWTEPLSSFDPAVVPYAPDYADDSAWWWRPANGENVDAAADLFFVQGTTHFNDRIWNAEIDKERSDWRLLKIALPALTGPFKECCRRFAPKYREAGMATFLKVNESSRQALELAYGDIRAAFLAYLEYDNAGRPLILAGHSQGSLHLQRLLAEFSNDPRVRNRLVVAYLIGFATPLGATGDFGPCTNARDFRCFVSWTTMGEGGATERWQERVTVWSGVAYAKSADHHAVCVNPLTWRTDETRASAVQHKGGTLTPLSDLAHSGLVGARCKNGVLHISHPPNPAFNVLVLPGRDYHIMEYNLFHKDIEANVADRLAASRGE